MALSFAIWPRRARALARAEVRLTRLELGGVARGIGKGTALAAIGVVFALLGGLSLLVGVVLLIGDQWMPSDRYWLAALIMLVITFTIAAWLARRGATLRVAIRSSRPPKQSRRSRRTRNG